MKKDARAARRMWSPRSVVNQLEIGGDKDVKTQAVCRNWRDVKFYADLAERPHYVVGAKRSVT